MRVLLAEDHKIVRQGTRMYLESMGVEIVGEATSFHATRVAPGWRGLRRVSQIGNHIFYAAR